MAVVIRELAKGDKKIRDDWLKLRKLITNVVPDLPANRFAAEESGRNAVV